MAIDPETPPSHPSRLSEAEGSEPIAPFSFADALTRCELYWLPSSFPARQAERDWMRRFIAELKNRLGPNGEVSAELFLEATVIHEHVHDAFIQNALDFNPIMTMSRAPGAALPTEMDMKYIEDLRNQRATFDLKRFSAGFCYYFVAKLFAKQMNAFWGFGGMTVMLVKPDPATMPPPLRIPSGVKKHPAYQQMAQEQDLEGKLAIAYGLQAPFLKKSKEYFGTGWEQRLEYRGLLCILPRWKSSDFFTLPVEEVVKLFDICDVFITESPADQGILVASGKPIRKVISEICRQMTDEQMIYPEQS